MTASSSSEDENLDSLREAVDKDLINDDMFKDKKVKEKAQSIRKQLPSLRPVKDNNEQFNLLDVTPEFQQHVGKHLMRILDKQLEKDIVYCTDNKPSLEKHDESSGIRLFNDSKDFISLDLNESSNIKPRKKEIKRKILEEDTSNKDVKVSLCAVNPEDVLSKKDTEFWTERRKNKVFEYKSDKTGQLVLVEEEFK